MTFVSKTMVERSQTASRQSIKQGDYMCHVFVRGDNLAGVLFSDHEYPHRVAHTLVTNVLNEFSKAVPASSWPSGMRILNIIYIDSCNDFSLDFKMVVLGFELQQLLRYYLLCD